MAHKIRSVPIDRENLPVASQKSGPISNITRRPALGELGNKLHLQSKRNIGLKVGGNEPAVKKLDETKKKVNQISKPVLRKAVTTVVSTKQAAKPTNVLLVKPNKLLPQVKVKDQEEIAFSSKPLIDADAGDENDIMLVSEYIMDIFGYLREMEAKYPIKAGFLGVHQSTPRMRSVLVSWLIEVHMNFKFLQETLHLSIAILDRYLQMVPSVGKETLQLVGTAAVLIAGKYEEIYLPELSDFVYICDDSFSKQQILAMEIDILNKLHFNLGRPLSLHFLRRYNKVAKVQPEVHTLGKYLLEIGLLEYELCHINPSLQAAAACCLAMGILDEVDDPETVWTKTMVYYSTYNYSTIKNLVADFAYALLKQETSKYQALRSKYSRSNSGKISLHPCLKGALVQKLSAKSTLANRK